MHSVECPASSCLLLCTDSGQVVDTNVPLSPSPSSIILYWPYTVDGKVTAGLIECNGSLLPGLWLIGWIHEATATRNWYWIHKAIVGTTGRRNRSRQLSPNVFSTHNCRYMPTCRANDRLVYSPYKSFADNAMKPWSASAPTLLSSMAFIHLQLQPCTSAHTVQNSANDVRYPTLPKSIINIHLQLF